MCKRCSELEIEIEAAEEYGFGLTSFQLQEELEALQDVEAAQQSVQRTVDQPCEKHNMEFCSECFPVVVVDFNRR